MIQDALQLKERIVSIIKLRGPSLPVHVAKETGLSILFASAFLSELFHDKRIRISDIKIGTSPLYFIPGQEPQLEKFSQYLKSKEKDAFLLIKEKKFLIDSEQEPAIRVALREIKDFAIPFEREGKIYWRYFIIPEEEFISEKESNEKEEIKEEIEIKEIVLEEKAEIPEEEKETPKKEKVQRKLNQKAKPKKQNKNKKKDENFFNKIKESLSKKGVEILDIENFKDEEATLRVKKEDTEELFFVFNKKKITEKEILKAHKKASETGMKYSILFLGEVPKKMNDLVAAIKGLSKIDKIE